MALRGLSQVIRVGTILDERIVLGCASGIVARPSDNRLRALNRLKIRSFGDLYAGGSVGRRRNHLTACSPWAEYDDHCKSTCERQKEFAHVKTSIRLNVSSEKDCGSYSDSSAREAASWRNEPEYGEKLSHVRFECHGIGLVGKGATPQIADGQAGSGGVGIRNSFPCVFAEPPFKHAPVYLSRFGKGIV